jgi:hypothetical protein
MKQKRPAYDDRSDQTMQRERSGEVDANQVVVPGIVTAEL